MTSSAVNAAQLSTALSFSPQVALDQARGTVLGNLPVIPPAVEILNEEAFVVRFYAPTAQTVTVRIVFEEYALTKEENGLWSTVIPIGEGGLKPVYFQVDGVTVINPMMSVGYGSSSPCNIVDLPQDGVDFYHLKDVPHGTVCQEFYPSTVTGRHESCLVYTPPGYMNGTDSYPVLYLQHGHGENEQCWVHHGKVNFIMDNLLDAGLAKPCMIVMNNGMVQSRDPDGSLRVKAMLLPDLLTNDCIPYIENVYRVRPGKENRAVAGLSMGSVHASILSMTHPELFAWAGIFSGFVQMPPLLGGYNSHLNALKNPAKFRSEYQLFFRAIGEDDIFMDSFLSDRKLLEEYGLSPEKWDNHIEKFYPGNHEWNVWRLCIRDFLMKVFR